MFTRWPFTVKCPWCHQLTSLAAGVGKAHAEHYVVQTALQLLQQHLTGDALLALGLLA